MNVLQSKLHHTSRNQAISSQSCVDVTAKNAKAHHEDNLSSWCEVLPNHNEHAAWKQRQKEYHGVSGKSLVTKSTQSLRCLTVDRLSPTGIRVPASIFIRLSSWSSFIQHQQNRNITVREGISNQNSFTTICSQFLRSQHFCLHTPSRSLPQTVLHGEHETSISPWQIDFQNQMDQQTPAVTSAITVVAHSRAFNPSSTTSKGWDSMLFGSHQLWQVCPVNHSISSNLSDAPNGYHGYWATDLTSINSYYGSASDLKSLVSAAHSKVHLPSFLLTTI